MVVESDTSLCCDVLRRSCVLASSPRTKVAVFSGLARCLVHVVVPSMHTVYTVTGLDAEFADAHPHPPRMVSTTTSDRDVSI